MHLYDKYSYSMKDYKELREKNRLCFQADVEHYCRNQIDYEPKYEIGVEGREYVMCKFIKGLRHINKTYGEKITVFTSFDEMYKLNFRLPSNIDFMVMHNSAVTFMKTRYVSHNIAFTYAVGDRGSQLQIHYPANTPEVEELAKFIIRNGFREYVRS